MPLRAVSEALGADVSWINGVAKIELSGKIITMQVGEKQAQVNGKAQALSAAPILQEGRILVPLRCVSEQLGAKVDYADRQVDIMPTDDMLPNLSTQYTLCQESGAYIYLQENGGRNLTRIDKNTDERVEISLPSTELLLLDVDNDMVYYRKVFTNADGNSEGYLCAATLDGSEEMKIGANYGSPQICDGYLYYLVKNSKTISFDLYRMGLKDGRPSGDGELVSGYVLGYSFAGGRIYTTAFDDKRFIMNLDGTDKQMIVRNRGDELDFDRVRDLDCGWFYAVNYERDKLYRFRSGVPYELVLDLSDSKMTLGSVKVLGNKIYHNVQIATEYTPGREGYVTGGLYEMDLNGNNRRTLTEDKAVKFYVLSDKILYQTQVGDGYPQAGGDWFEWRMIDK